MRRQWCSAIYTVEFTHDNIAGSSTAILNRQDRDRIGPVARITFWDAVGQFFLGPTTEEIPLKVMEEFIATTKQTIKVR